ncbi:hypothetical protein [Primorskyibacter sp. S187A]|uniref:hypothetical protein n=1 Tax=Primorskyibacter sp. S187A TaxID=3415130 RepID=UPI003C7B7EA4
MKKHLLILAGLVMIAGPITAQTPTPEELLAKIDAKLEAANPYQALLNDPDPRRSLAAMEVMLESGDNDLAKMAIEFGLQSPNPQVQDIALRGVLASRPALNLSMDGSKIDTPQFSNSILSWLKGSVDSQNIGSAQLLIGEYDEKQSCYTRRTDGACLFTLTTDGVILKIDSTLTTQMVLGPDGVLTGEGFLYNVGEPVPMRIRLMQ